jgi:hypothetical protein
VIPNRSFAPLDYPLCTIRRRVSNKGGRVFQRVPICLDMGGTHDERRAGAAWRICDVKTTTAESEAGRWAPSAPLSRLLDEPDSRDRAISAIPSPHVWQTECIKGAEAVCSMKRREVG